MNHEPGFAGTQYNTQDPSAVNEHTHTQPIKSLHTLVWLNV